MSKFFALAMMLLATMCVRAQYEEGTFTLQPKIGFVASTLTNMPNLPVTETLDLKSSIFPGALIGVEGEYQVADRLGIALGLNYSLQGGRWNDYFRPQMNITKTMIKLGYINMPLVANFYIVGGLAVKTGIQFSFLTHARSTSRLAFKDADGKVRMDNYDENVKSDCNGVDFAIPVGLSYEFGNHLIIDARYHFSLRRLNKVIETDEPNMFNRVFMLTLGYKIGL
jgi:opacity protein-like surface antigen